jgi:maleate isomerase
LAVVSPEEIAAFSAERLQGVKADILFFSCTNFRAIEALPMLRNQFNIPIVTSITATLDAILAMEKKMQSQRAA